MKTLWILGLVFCASSARMAVAGDPGASPEFRNAVERARVAVVEFRASCRKAQDNDGLVLPLAKVRVVASKNAQTGEVTMESRYNWEVGYSRLYMVTVEPGDAFRDLLNLGPQDRRPEPARPLPEYPYVRSLVSEFASTPIPPESRFALLKWYLKNLDLSAKDAEDAITDFQRLYALGLADPPVQFNPSHRMMEAGRDFRALVDLFAPFLRPFTTESLDALYARENAQEKGSG